VNRLASRSGTRLVIRQGSRWPSLAVNRSDCHWRCPPDHPHLQALANPPVAAARSPPCLGYRRSTARHRRRSRTGNPTGARIRPHRCLRWSTDWSRCRPGSMASQCRLMTPISPKMTTFARHFHRPRRYCRHCCRRRCCHPATMTATTRGSRACRWGTLWTRLSCSPPQAANNPAPARQSSGRIFGAFASSPLGQRAARRVRGPGLHCLDASRALRFNLSANLWWPSTLPSRPAR
jgi:hypothetical protein